MEISEITAPASQAKAATTGLAEDFDTFLTLLTAQLQHQDPLSPMETNDFMDQLAQFTAVEQSIQTNENLENLIALTQDSATSAAVSYIGKDVVLNTETGGLNNGSAQWTYNLGASSEVTNLAILDSAGRIVHQEAGATSLGAHSFSWDGTNTFGQALPDGAYTLVVSAFTDGDTQVPSTVSVKGRVTGVTTDGQEPEITIGGVSYKLTDIVAIEDPAETDT